MGKLLARFQRKNCPDVFFNRLQRRKNGTPPKIAPNESVPSFVRWFLEIWPCKQQSPASRFRRGSVWGLEAESSMSRASYGQRLLESVKGSVKLCSQSSEPEGTLSQMLPRQNFTWSQHAKILRWGQLTHRIVF